MADVAVLILFDKEKRMLLQHRTAYKERWANHWGVFGGSLEEGETPKEALQRELFEELAYATKEPVLFCVQSLTHDKKHVFIEEVDPSQTLVPNQAECQALGWFTFEEIVSLQCIPHDVEVLRKISEHLHKVV